MRERIPGKMNDKRYLCSDLLHLRGTSGWRGWVNLEEIWRTGAILESDTAIPIGQKLLIRKDRCKLWAEVVSHQPHEFGCRVQVSFLFDFFWTPELFEPEHMLDPDKVRLKQEEANEA